MIRSVFLLTLSLSFFGLSAQQYDVVASQGKSYETSTMILDWTLGEVVVTSIEDSNNLVTQGFHQPTYVITNVRELSDDIGTISFYPNPVSDHITYTASLRSELKLKLVILDLYGNEIFSLDNPDPNVNNTIGLKSLPAGNYILDVRIDEGRHRQTFKIQKLNK